MIVIGVGVNYVTEVFSFVGRSLSSGFDWYCTILDKIGLPWEVFSLILIGFTVSFFLVSGVVGSYRDSADSVFSDSVQAQRRLDSLRARQESALRRAKYAKIYEARTEMYKERNRKLLEYWNDRHFQKWREQ